MYIPFWRGGGGAAGPMGEVRSRMRLTLAHKRDRPHDTTQGDVTARDNTRDEQMLVEVGRRVGGG